MWRDHVVLSHPSSLDLGNAPQITGSGEAMESRIQCSGTHAIAMICQFLSDIDAADGRLGSMEQYVGSDES